MSYSALFHERPFVARPPHQGFTMVEILVVLGLTGLVFWILFSFFSGSARMGSERISSEMFTTWNRVVFARMGKDFRSARSVGETGGTVEMTVFSEDSGGKIRSRKVSYQAVGGRVERLAEGEQSHPVAGKCPGIETPGRDLEMTVTSTGRVVRVTLRITGPGKDGNPGTIEEASQEFRVQ